jgi:hypothetical protein
MQLTTSAIEAMGFRRINAGEEIVAAFHSLNVFEIQGFTVSKDSCFTTSGIVSGFDYELGVGSSVNDISMALLADDFTENETAWAEEHQCRPPYALLHCGPTSEQSSGPGYVKQNGSTIMTYDSFGPVKDQLRSIEAKVLPAVQTSLACEFTFAPHKVRFNSIDRNVFGLTSDKVVVHDIRLGGSATAYTASALPPADIQEAMERVGHLAAIVNPKVARFFKLALEDKDSLKRFLYFFLAIEIETHKRFASIDIVKSCASLLNVPERIRASAVVLLENTSGKWNLADRFTWCVVNAWHHMSDADVSDFRRLKKVRDGIAHGVISVPPADSVVAVEALAGKLQLLKRR